MNPNILALAVVLLPIVPLCIFVERWERRFVALTIKEAREARDRQLARMKGDN